MAFFPRCRASRWRARPDWRARRERLPWTGSLKTRIRVSRAASGPRSIRCSAAISRPISRVLSIRRPSAIGRRKRITPSICCNFARLSSPIARISTRWKWMCEAAWWLCSRPAPAWTPRSGTALLQQELFDAEQKRFRLGASTPYNVALQQRDLIIRTIVGSGGDGCVQHRARHPGPDAWHHAGSQSHHDRTKRRAEKSSQAIFVTSIACIETLDW